MITTGIIIISCVDKYDQIWHPNPNHYNQTWFPLSIRSIKTFQQCAQIGHLIRIKKSSSASELSSAYHRRHFLGQCALKSDPNKGRSNLFQITFRAANLKDTNITLGSSIKIKDTTIGEGFNRMAENWEFWEKGFSAFQFYFMTLIEVHIGCNMNSPWVNFQSEKITFELSTFDNNRPLSSIEPTLDQLFRSKATMKPAHNEPQSDQANLKLVKIKSNNYN